MDRTHWLLTLLFASLIAAGCASGEQADGRDHHGSADAVSGHHDDDADDAGGDDGEEDERPIPVSDVPANVLAAAQKALPGVAFTEAEVETENGATVYCLSGAKDGAAWEVEVAADGRVLEVEQEDD